jgi:Phytanoyl-CoA dioxygenase (PhyH)
MNTIYMDAAIDDEKRRKLLYEGQLFAFSNRPSIRALAAFAGEMIQEAFPGLDPLTAQYHMPVEKFVEIFGPLKPKFIHHPESKRLIREVLKDFGCDLEETYQDVPRLRAVTSDAYLTSGVGYAHHPHRDTWYSAPASQINWWLPIFEMASESSMAFHPRYWSEPVKNGSREFNYYEWNSTGRANAAQHIKSDTRKQPKPEQPMELDPQVRLVPEPGGVILFSAAQMHSTVPNTSGKTRFSIDFRTVSLRDVREQKGAPNIDSECTGTSLRDFLRASDLSAMPEDAVELYDQSSLGEGVLVYKP